MIWSNFLNKATHHRELAVSKPHHPTSSICSSTSATHPPGNDPTGPPRETSQLPKHQWTDAKTPAILLAHGKQGDCQDSTDKESRQIFYATIITDEKLQYGSLISATEQ